MIDKIEMNGVASYKQATCLETDKKVNLVYGLNGVGKSTLSNFLYDPKNEMYKNCKLHFPEGDSLDNYEILVYNQTFLKENFYESSEIKGIFSLSKENKDAQKAVDDANIELKRIDEEKKQKNSEKEKLKNEKKDIGKKYENKVWQIKVNYADDDKTLKYCLTGYLSEKNKLFEYLKSIEKPSAIPSRSIDDLKKETEILSSSSSITIPSISQLIYDLDVYESNNLLKKEIVGNKNSSISSFIEELKNSDWVKVGRKYLKPNLTKQKCPFCQSETIDENFIKEVESYFDESYDNDMEQLRSNYKAYKTKRDSFKEIDVFKIYNSILGSFYDSYHAAFVSLLACLDENLRLVENKIEKPSLSISLKNTKPFFDKINIILSQAEKVRKEYNEKINNKNQSLNNIKKEFWQIIRIEYDDVLDDCDKELKSKEKEINLVENEIQKLVEKEGIQKNIIEDNQKNIINIDESIEHINNGLIDIGIDNFKIKKYSDNLYKIEREGVDEDVFKTLSEGEKMIISLLYFIERCKGTISKESSPKKKIIVIDDPISSLSHIYVYNVGRLIIQEFTDADEKNKNTTKYDQIFLLTHSLYFFYEMAIVKRKGKEDDYNQKLFRIKKTEKGSSIAEMKYGEIQNDYQSYWAVIKDKDNASPALIANCMRNIIEYFFSFIEKLELNNVFNRPELQDSRFKAFNRYINRESHSLGQNIFDIKEFDYDSFKEGLRLVFKETGYEDHYKKMMKM